MKRHPRDPAAPWRAIPTLAGLIAAGLLDRAEALSALAAAPAPDADPAGWQARRDWTLADQQAQWQAARRRAVWAVRDALAPLLARRADREALERQAERADAAAVLLPAERRRLVAGEVARCLRGRGR